MVTQNTTTAAGAAPTGARIRLNTPQANQQVVIDNIAGATLEMGFPSEAAQLEQSGQDLVFLFENGGRIVLSNFFGLFESNQLPAFNLEDGQSLPGDAFLAALREDLLPAAGPGAGAAAGSGGVGDYADDAGDLIGGVDRLDPLGTGTFGVQALPGIEDVGPLDPATGSLLITINTNISTTIEQNGEYPEHPDAVPPGTYAGVFEDWEPNQHLGSHLSFEAVLGFIFTPTDNEVLDSITITGPIAGTLLVGGVPVAADGAGNFVISAADIDDVTLLPLADSGTDIPLSGFASITDPDSGLSGTVPFAFTAVVDAVADQPTGVHETVSYGPFYCDHGDGGNGDGEVINARVMDSEGDERSFWHHNPHDAPDGPWWKHTAANPTETEDGDHVQSAVKITLSATFGDYQDGSESHFLLIEAKEGWTYDTVNIGGVELDLSEFLTLGADIPASATQGDGVINPAGYYYVIPVGDESIVATSQSVDGQGQTHELATKAVTLTLYAPDEDYVSGGNGGYEGNGDYEGPVIATLDQGYNGDGEHCGRGNDYKETFVTGALAVDSDADGSLVAVNDNSLVFGSTDVWVAAAEGHIYVTGQQIGYEDPQAFAHDPPSWYDPFSTKDIDLDFHFSGADDEHLDYLRIAVDPETPAKVLIFGSEALLVPDGEGGSYYIVPAHLKDHVTLMPAKDSDVDVKLTVTAVFHDPDSGDVGTDTTQHTVFIDAVADKPIAHDADVDYTPGPTAGDPGGTLTVTLNATFGDYQDGSERQYVGIEVKHGWSYPGNEGYKLVDGRLYAIYDVTDEVDAGSGSVSLPITLGVVSTDDRYYSEFKTIAIAQETNFSGVEWNLGNNQAHDTDSVTILVDGADGCLQVSGQGYEDRMPNAHDNNPYNDAIQPIKLDIDLNGDDDEVIDSVNIKALGQSFTIVVDGVPTHLSTGESINVDGSKANSVYIIPEEHNGKDIRIEATATIHDPDSGDLSVRSDTSTIVIDAVADKPVNLFETVDYGAGHDAVDPPNGATVSVTATFADVLDGSEHHYIGIEIKSGWDYPSGGVSQNINGTWYKVYDVTSMDNSGTLTKTLNIDLTNNTDDRFTTNFKTVAIAIDSEIGIGDDDLTSSNDKAYTFGSVDVTVDGADGCLSVTSGNGGFEDWMPNADEGDMAVMKTALNIGFTPDENEVVDSLVIGYDGRPFTLVVGGTEYTLDGTPGHDTVTLTGAQLSEQLYIKTPLHSDKDIPVEVTANYHDPNSGDTGSAYVEHTVKIDAVADKPGVTIDVNDSGDGGASFQLGEAGSLHVTASFADTDGSEAHTVVLNIPAGFDVSNLGGGTWDAGARTVTWNVGSGGSLDKTITVTQNGAGDGSHDFTATAKAVEVGTPSSGSENYNYNNVATSTATDAAIVNSGRAIQWSITDAHDVSNIVQESDLGVNGPPLAFTVGYSGYALQAGETVSIQLTGPAAGSTANLADFTNAADDFKAALESAVGAVSGISYNAATNTLTFSYGAPTSLTFFAKVYGDNTLENNEDLVLTIQNPKFNGFVGGTVADGSEDGTIIDDDAPVIVPPTGGGELSLSLQDVDAAGVAEDQNDGDLDFTAGSLPLEFAFDLSSGNEPHVSGIDPSTPITWTVDGGTGNLIGSIGGEPAIILTLAPEAGPYTTGQSVQVNVEATLIDPLLHDDGATDIVVTNVHVSATDGVSPAVHGTVSVSVDDAAPTAAPEVDEYSGGMTTNVVLVLDVSGSMGDDANGDAPGNTSRLEFAKAAIMDLIDAYQDLGAVNVKLVWFDSNADTHEGWLTGPNVTTALQNLLNTLSDDGNTDYDDAISLVMSELADGLPPADRSVVYFLSDGDPNPNSDGLNDTERADWEAFLQGSPIDMVYAFGMGADITSTTELNPVGWERGVAGDANTVDVIENLSDLSAFLQSTVPTMGNLLANDNGGADSGLALDSVTVDGVTHYIGEADAGTHKLALDLHDGKGILTIDFDDGSYVFTPGSTPVGQEIVNYDVRDADGTLAHTTLTLNLRAAELDAHDNYTATVKAVDTDNSAGFDDNNYNDWSHPAHVNIVGHGDYVGDKELELNVGANENGSVESSKTFYDVNAGDSISFQWSAELIAANTNYTHDADSVSYVIEKYEWSFWDGWHWEQVHSETLYTAGDATTSGTEPYTFGSDGTYRMRYIASDGNPDGSNNNRLGGLNAYLDDVVYMGAYATIAGNVVSDHVATDIVDQIGGQTAFVTEVNGVAIPNDGDYHTVTGDYGTLSINAFGQYEYHANAGTAAGNDDAFVYKLASTSDSDYATLNVHIGDTANHLQASAENWTGGGSNDFHLGGTGGDALNGGNGNDVIFGNYGNDTIHGNAGHDTLHGNAGNDTIYGDAGNDTIIGGQGSDILYGDDLGHTVHGADTFVWNAEDFTTSAVDRVTDFNMGEGDVLRFSDVLIGNNPDVVAGGALAGTDANDVVVTLHSGANVQHVVIQDALVGAPDTSAALNAIEQHILTNKIITENS